MRALPLIVSLSLALVSAAHAQGSGKHTYRWTDDKGRVHYSDVPAPKSERVDVKASGKVSAVPAEVAAAEARARECQRRKDQLASYNGASDISETDSLGNTRSFSEAEKKKLVERINQQVKDVCGDAEAPQP